MSGGCPLCAGEHKKQKNKVKRGGSIASNAVTDLVSCDTWKTLDEMQSNVVAPMIAPIQDSYAVVDQEGGKRKCKRIKLTLTTTQKTRRSAHKGGAGGCDSQPMDLVQPYVESVPQVTLPASSLASIDASQIPPSAWGEINLLNPMINNTTLPIGLVNMTNTGQ